MNAGEVRLQDRRHQNADRVRHPTAGKRVSCNKLKTRATKEICRRSETCRASVANQGYSAACRISDGVSGVVRHAFRVSAEIDIHKTVRGHHGARLEQPV